MIDVYKLDQFRNLPQLQQASYETSQPLAQPPQTASTATTYQPTYYGIDQSLAQPPQIASTATTYQPTRYGTSQPPAQPLPTLTPTTFPPVSSEIGRPLAQPLLTASTAVGSQPIQQHQPLGPLERKRPAAESPSIRPNKHQAKDVGERPNILELLAKWKEAEARDEQYISEFGSLPPGYVTSMNELRLVMSELRNDLPELKLPGSQQGTENDK